MLISPHRTFLQQLIVFVCLDFFCFYAVWLLNPILKESLIQAYPAILNSIS